jgi:hypothetical protein
VSKHEAVVEGVSQVTVKNGDTTFFFDIENLVIEEDDGYGDDVWEMGDYNRFRDTTYAIKGSMVRSGDGYYYRVVKPVVKTPVLRTAEIEVGDFEPHNVEAARIKAEAPDGAFYSRVWDSNGNTKVRFEWSEEK